MSEPATVSVLLCGDVMTGRGIDLALPHPGNSQLHESYCRDASDYIALAETAHGRFARPVDFTYIWGDALPQFRDANVDLRIINLETSITTSDRHWTGKGIHYRMHPENIGCLTAAQIDGCNLANNHVLDWGRQGLIETFATLERASIARAGAGQNIEEARRPAVLKTGVRSRVLLFGLGSTSSGIPPEWSATANRAGLNVLTELSIERAKESGAHMRQFKRPGDITIASIHWGNNWGYDIPQGQIDFAHQLIDEGFDLIHGHSSHHAKGFEIYRGHLILYGCGDLITDYEGISGYEQFRGDLALLYLVKLSCNDGRLLALRIFVMQMQRFQLRRASVADVKWLISTLNSLDTQFQWKLTVTDDNSLTFSPTFNRRIADRSSKLNDVRKTR